MAYEYLEDKGKIVANLGVDDVNTALYLWDNTCSGDKLNGKDCFGNDSDGGVTISSNNGTTWTGFGWCRLAAFDFSKIDDFSIFCQPKNILLYE